MTDIVEVHSHLLPPHNEIYTATQLDILYRTPPVLIQYSIETVFEIKITSNNIIGKTTFEVSATYLMFAE